MKNNLLSLLLSSTMLLSSCDLSIKDNFKTQESAEKQERYVAGIIKKEAGLINYIVEATTSEETDKSDAKSLKDTSRNTLIYSLSAHYVIQIKTDQKLLTAMVFESSNYPLEALALAITPGQSVKIEKTALARLREEDGIGVLYSNEIILTEIEENKPERE